MRGWYCARMCKVVRWFCMYVCLSGLSENVCFISDCQDDMNALPNGNYCWEYSKDLCKGSSCWYNFCAADGADAQDACPKTCGTCGGIALSLNICCFARACAELVFFLSYFAGGSRQSGRRASGSSGNTEGDFPQTL